MQLYPKANDIDAADQILHGRVGMRQWMKQGALLVVMACMDFALLIACFVDLQLAGLGVLLVVNSLLIVGLKLCFRPLSWLGFDLSPPVIFDVEPDGTLEVGAWRYWLLQKRKIPRDALTTVGVYSIIPDGDPDHKSMPLKPGEQHELVFPHCGDACRECSNSLMSCCLPCRLTLRPLSVAYLGAAVRGESRIIPLTRIALSLETVEEMFELAEALRRRTGASEPYVPDAGTTSLRPMEADADALGPEELLGSDDVLQPDLEAGSEDSVAGETPAHTPAATNGASPTSGTTSWDDPTPPPRREPEVAPAAVAPPAGARAAASAASSASRAGAAGAGEPTQRPPAARVVGDAADSYGGRDGPSAPTSSVPAREIDESRSGQVFVERVEAHSGPRPKAKAKSRA